VRTYSLEDVARLGARGEDVVALDAFEVELPPEVDIDSRTLREIRIVVNLSKVKIRDLPVKPAFSVERLEDQGWELVVDPQGRGAWEATPSKVACQGPQEVIQEVKQIVTAEIEVLEALQDLPQWDRRGTSSFAVNELSTTLRPPPGIKPELETVGVTFAVRPKHELFTWVVEPTISIEPGQRLEGAGRLEPVEGDEKAMIQLRGPVQAAAGPAREEDGEGDQSRREAVELFLSSTVEVARGVSRRRCRVLAVLPSARREDLLKEDGWKVQLDIEVHPPVGWEVIEAPPTKEYRVVKPAAANTGG
jgi:hypothetical protein